MIKKLLLAFPLILSSCAMRPLYAQTVVQERPDCWLPLGLISTISAGASAGPFDNRVNGCTTWAIIYNSNGFSALSLIVQTAPDAGGTPGSWSTFTAVSGSNPNTTTTQATSTFGGPTSYFPWLRVQLTSKTGTGSISGALYGCRTNSMACVSSISAIIAGTVTVVGNKSNNAVVPGSTNLGVLPCVANAADPTWTETFQVTCSTDLSGHQRVVATGPVAVGAAVGGNPLRAGGANTAGNVVGLKLGNNGGVLGESVTAASTDGNNNSALVPRVLNEAGGALSVGFDRFFPFIFNGGTTTAWDRVRSASLANDPVSTTLTARNSIGAHLVEKGGRWTVVSTPATDIAASASIASEASVRHIIDCVSFSASSGGAVTAANVTVNIRDGATGAGTVIWSFQLSTPTIAALGVQAISPHSVCGLNLVGTTATAMTAEFSAGVTNVIESISMSGYNVN